MASSKRAAATARVRTVPIATAGIFALIVAKQAWISDDSLTIARTVMNWLRGYGPYFNIGEAAQAFTSPLWFIVAALVSWVTRDVVVTLIAMGVVASAAGAYFLARDLTKWWQAALLTIPLASSLAITDFATSGLENPLMFLLLVVAWRQAKQHHLVAATAAMGLLVVTRYDMALLAIPAVGYAAYYVWQRERTRFPRLVVAALAPLLTWFAVSAAVYGSVFAETAHAKLNLIIPRREMLGQGVGYLIESFFSDWVTFGLVTIAVVAVFSRSLAGFTRSLALGTSFYLLYVVWIGGDFMIGRFVFVPAVVGLIVVAEVLNGGAAETLDNVGPFSAFGRALRPLTVAVLVVGLLGVVTLSKEDHPVTEHPIQTEARWSSDDPLRLGIADERRLHVENGYGLWNWLLLEPYNSTLTSLRKALREWPSGAVVSEVRIQCGALGTESVFQGPSVHYVDTCGKADPFLARHIPFEASEGEWRIGHYRREIPAGYIEALVSGDARFLDEVHRQAFESISLSRRIEDRWPQDPASVKTP